MKEIRTFRQLMNSFPDEKTCREFLEEVRWQGEPICPHCKCSSDKHYELKIKGEFKGLRKCRRCRKRFTVTVGTMFEGSHISLCDWFYAIYIFLSHKKGISSVQLAKDIDVTQKTAWFMLHRIRHNFEDKIGVRFETETQVDETYIGGKNRKRKGLKGTQGRSTLIKTPVVGLVSEGMAYTIVVPNVRKETLNAIIRTLVKKGTTVVTDGLKSYHGLSKNYTHKVVEHSEGEYVKDGFHTNSIEGFWSHLKRGLMGIYHFASPKHLASYCNEFAFRYNTRDLTDMQRFMHFLPSFNQRLSYWELVN